MKINGQPYRTIWCETQPQRVCIIDQTRLPHSFEVVELTALEHFCRAIVTMQVRGAPLIGATAAWGVAVEMGHNPSDEHLAQVCQQLLATRPTAVNLRWALQRMQTVLAETPWPERGDRAMLEAQRICDDDVVVCSAIGEHGLALLQQRWQEKQRMGDNSPVNVLTHCNAGWLATVDWGTAMAPVYKAHTAGIPVHVWVDETRPRNQGAFLTAYELGQQGIAHTVIADNSGGHLMQHDQVDMVIVGTDRTTANGDVCNKIGTYLKALAARDNQVPFYVALPTSTIDWTLNDGFAIPIEQRSADEVTQISGVDEHGDWHTVAIAAPGSAAANHAFDVTPARLVTGLITEFGLYQATPESLARIQAQL